MAEGDTLTNAFVGAIATVILSPFVPFAPIAGGALAGYLQGGRSDDGLRVGGVSGAIAFVPALLVGAVVLWVMGAIVAGIGGPSAFFGGLGTVVIVLVLIVAAIYVVGLSILGGWIGNYLKGDTEW
jgi:hypothetical protein